MKAFRLIGMALLAVMMYANFISCNKDSDSTEVPEDTTNLYAGTKWSAIYNPMEFMEFTDSNFRYYQVDENGTCTHVLAKGSYRVVDGEAMFNNNPYKRPDDSESTQYYLEYAAIERGQLVLYSYYESLLAGRNYNYFYMDRCN